jgi:phenylacetate-coenzyme A ligase PaaK-like adenylate-forming protein
MNYRRKIFLMNPYNLDKSKQYFLNAVKENIGLHIANCPEYAQILEDKSFDIDCLKSEYDLHRIPVIPTLYFKRNRYTVY